MIKKVFVFIGFVVFSSCVSSKVYKDLESDYARLKKEMRAVANENEDLLSAKKDCEATVAQLQDEIASLNSEKAKIAEDLAAANKRYADLKASFEALEKNSSSALAENAEKQLALSKQLEAKEAQIKKENDRLLALQQELHARSQRIDELETALAAKDANMKALKESISKALTNFEGKGLTVEQRDGKVYVSMENKLLFNSGSWKVGKEGRKAVVQLGGVLAQNPEINVLIEGHTDDDPHLGKGAISGNWDLSTKRATEIVKILMDVPNISPENLTAAGKSKYLPVATNETVEGKSKNRRIEVVLTPKLDAISKLLNEEN
jgi:chemotaxis protein MotB